MQNHFCPNCGTEQGYVGEIKSFIYCERCGSKIHSDGSCSYEGTIEGIQQMKDNADYYDNRNHFRDRQDYERNKHR